MQNESQLWLVRFQHYDALGRSLWERTAQLIGVGMTLLATLVAVVSAAESDWTGLLAVVPFVVLLLWAVASRMLHEFFYLMAFKDYAEIRMYNKPRQAKEGLSSWHAVATPAILQGLPNIIAYVLIALFSVFLTAFALIQLWIAQPAARVWIGLEALVVSLGLVVVGLAFHRTISEVKQLFLQLDQELEGGRNRTK